MSNYQVVVTDAALNAILELRLAAIGGGGGGGGTGSDNVVTMEQYGSFVSGLADPTVDEAALTSAINALAAKGGGVLVLYKNYAIANNVAFTGDNYANIGIVGQTPVSGFHRTNDHGTQDGSAMISFTGATTYGLKNLVMSNFSLEGFSINDYTRMILFDNADGVHIDGMSIKNNAVEGIYGNGSNKVKNMFVSRSRAINIGLGAQKLSAFNLNSDNMGLFNSKAVNCGQGLEQQGRNFRIIGNHFETCVFSALLIGSTWASWLDPFDGVTIHTSNNGVISGNEFIDCENAIETGDTAGHLDHGVPVPGNGGAFNIIGNTFIRCTQLLVGGSDQFKVCNFKGNYAEDSFSNANAAVNWQKGWIVAEDNTFKIGTKSNWANIFRVGDRDPVNTKGTLRNNTVIGKCWNGDAYVVGPDVEIIDPRFLDIVPGTYNYIGLAGFNYNADGPISRWTSTTDSWFVPGGVGFCYSPYQPSTMRVLSGPPTKGTWKAGDRLENVAGTGVTGFRCTLGGTSDTIAGGVTATTTASSASVTIAGATHLKRYDWITITGLTGRYQLTVFDPASGAGTISPVASGGVSTAAVAFSPPVWEVMGVMATKAVSTTYTVTPLDQLLYYSTTGGAYAITLPAAATSEGRIFRFAKSDASSNALTLTAAGSDTINGAGTFAPVTTQYQITHVYCMGGKWYAHDDGVTGGGGGAVSTVFGRSGAVTAQSNDYSYAQLSGLPSTIAGISAGVATDFVTQLEATGDARYLQLGVTIADSLVTDTPYFTITSPGATPAAVWSLAHRQQVMTLSVNATVTVSAIPAGGSLLLRVFQAASGGPYTLTHAVSGLGTLFPDNNTTPTMSTGAGKFDDYLYRYDGTRTVYARILTSAG